MMSKPCLSCGAPTPRPRRGRCPACARANEREREARRRASYKARGLSTAGGRVKPSIRRAVLERDGYVCQLRLPGCTGYADTVDHILPWSRGGPGTAENLVAACLHCNDSKGNR